MYDCFDAAENAAMLCMSLMAADGADWWIVWSVSK